MCRGWGRGSASLVMLGSLGPSFTPSLPISFLLSALASFLSPSPRKLFSLSFSIVILSLLHLFPSSYCSISILFPDILIFPSFFHFPSHSFRLLHSSFICFLSSLLHIFNSFVIFLLFSCLLSPVYPYSSIFLYSFISSILINFLLFLKTSFVSTPNSFKTLSSFIPFLSPVLSLSFFFNSSLPSNLHLRAP